MTKAFQAVPVALSPSISLQLKLREASEERPSFQFHMPLARRQAPMYRSIMKYIPVYLYITFTFV